MNIYTEPCEYRDLLWAIIGQAVMDSTSLTFCERKCPYMATCPAHRDVPIEESPTVAMQWLDRMLGKKHVVVKATRQARRTGREIRVGNMAGGQGKHKREDD